MEINDEIDVPNPISKLGQLATNLGIEYEDSYFPDPSNNTPDIDYDFFDIVDDEEAYEAQIVPYFASTNGSMYATILLTNPENPGTMAFLKDLKNKGFSIKIILTTPDNLRIFSKLYHEEHLKKEHEKYLQRRSKELGANYFDEDLVMSHREEVLNLIKALGLGIEETQKLQILPYAREGNDIYVAMPGELVTDKVKLRLRAIEHAKGVQIKFAIASSRSIDVSFEALTEL